MPSPKTTASTDVVDKSFNNVPWPVRPSPGINYNFVTIMYLSGSAIALLFYTLETQMLRSPSETDENDIDISLTNQSVDDVTGGEGNGDEEGDNPWAEFAKGLEGMHLIFVPFIPCLLWSLIVRYYWLKETKISREKKGN